MFFEIFFFVCLFIYVVSIIETIGSYVLSCKEFGSYSQIYLWLSIFIPPLSPFLALAIFGTANSLYEKKEPNTHEVDESFYGYLFHGCNTITAWSKKHNNTTSKQKQ